MLRISITNASNNESFGFLVRYSDEVRAPLELDLLFTSHVVFQHLARFTGKFDGKIEIFHYWRLELVSAAMRSINFI